MQRYTSSSTRAHRRGFTIVELVVIIVVMGILASISVVGYGSWRQRTAENEVKSDLNGAKTAMESARNFGSDGYPTEIPFQPSENVTLSGGRAGDSKVFCITATSKRFSAIQYHIDNRSNVPKSGPCAELPGAPIQSPVHTGVDIYQDTTFTAYFREPANVGTGIIGFRIRATYDGGCATQTYSIGTGFESNSSYESGHYPYNGVKTYVFTSKAGGSGFCDVSGVYVSALSYDGYGPEADLPRVYNY